MELRIAKTAGFCFGVDRAVTAAFNLVDEMGKGTKVKTLGPLIHNPQIVQKLEALGVEIVSDIGQIQKGDTVIIRTHGVPKSEYEALVAVGATVVDATCPFVGKIHNIVEKAAENGETVLIFGHHNHPEVQGIQGFCDRAYIFSNLQELQGLLEKHPEFKKEKLRLVSQTTMNQSQWREACQLIKNMYTSTHISDTICVATDERQEEAKSLAKTADIMIVIGGRNSSNTTRLYEVCKEFCEKTFLVESADELPQEPFCEVAVVGVTAGASTPNDAISEVCKKMLEVK